MMNALHNKGNNDLNSAFENSPEESSFYRFFRLRGEWFILLLIILIAVAFRFSGLKEFSQVGGDDFEFRRHVPGHVDAFEYILQREGSPFARFKAPFLAAVYLSHWDVNRTVTSFAKPFFLLELGLLHTVFDLKTTPYRDIWRIHRWMAFLGIATVVAVFFLGKRFGGKWAGLAAAFLLAVSPWAVRYSTWGLHVAGGGFWFALALLAGSSLKGRDTLWRNLLFGFLISISVYYSTSMIWPALFLVLFELIRRIYSVLSPSSTPRRPLILLIAFIIGCLLPLLIWEGINWMGCRYLISSSDIIKKFPNSGFLALKESYISFPTQMMQTVKDNAAHTGTLPVDHLYFWRHLRDSEGWIVTGLVLASVVAGMITAAFGRFHNRLALLRLLFVFIGVVWIMGYTGGTQVARHYFSAELIGVVLFGILAARIIGRRPKAVYGLILFALLVAGQHFFHLEKYRSSRLGPSRFQRWARENNLTGQVASLNMQPWDLWPGLTFLSNWAEFDYFSTTRRRPHIMYSDYIGIAHGAWFYPTRVLMMMAETFRCFKDIAFITDSYLSYQPMLYENEFYYWGLYRQPSPHFDPRIKVMAAGQARKADQELRKDVEAQRELTRRLNQDPPVIIPAWRDLITLPYMERMQRPSYLLHGIISGALLLAYTFFCLGRLRASAPESGSALHGK